MCRLIIGNAEREWKAGRMWRISETEHATYKIVRSASCRLHEILTHGWNCSCLTEHHGNIRHRESRPTALNDNGGLFAGIRFDMAVLHKANEAIRTWFCIPPEPDELPEANIPIVLHSLPSEHPSANASSKRPFSRKSVSFLGELSESARADQPSSSGSTEPVKSIKASCIRPESSPATNLPITLQKLPLSRRVKPAAQRLESPDRITDLSQVSDWCEFAKRQQANNNNQCISAGTAKDDGIQYCCFPSVTQVVTEAINLSDILIWAAECPIVREFGPFEKYQLAALLSKMALQFYSTPWLADSMESKAIRFFTLKGPSTSMSLDEPHLSAKFSIMSKNSCSEDVCAGEAEEDSATKTTSPSLAINIVRSKFLFGLGLVLLEIGFSQPWPYLRSTVLESLPETARDDYHVAEKLSRILERRMDTEFPLIVRKCIGCDFGLGESDFNSEVLQKSFHDQIVVVLQDMQKKKPSA